MARLAARLLVALWLRAAETEDALRSLLIPMDEEWRARSLGLDPRLQLGRRGRVHRTPDFHWDVDRSSLFCTSSPT